MPCRVLKELPNPALCHVIGPWLCRRVPDYSVRCCARVGSPPLLLLLSNRHGNGLWSTARRQSSWGSKD